MVEHMHASVCRKRGSDCPRIAWRQAMPKGGYYRLAIGYTHEHHLRVLRAILGGACDEDIPRDVRTTGAALRQYIADEKLLRSSITYRQLHAVAASLFVTMAIDLYSPGGRLHNPKKPTPARRERRDHRGSLA